MQDSPYTKILCALILGGVCSLSGCAAHQGEVVKVYETPTTNLKIAENSTTSQPAERSTSLSDVLDVGSVPSTIRLAKLSTEDASPVETKLIEHTQRMEELTLGMLEEIALTNNPTIRQLSASASQAAGVRDQVRRRPNPTIGYNAAQLADSGTDQHSLFIEQEIVRGNKLALNWSVLNQATHAQLWEVEAQRQRVLTDIRMRYYEAVAAQQKLVVTKNFLKVAEKGVEVAQKRQSAGETSQVEVLQARVQLNEIELAFQQIQANLDGAWKDLAAIAGVPEMDRPTLEENLEAEEIDSDWGILYQNLLAQSPELSAARTRVAQAQAMLCRQQAQPISNLTLQLGTGYDNGTDNGLINLQIGAPIPVFNDNSGNISAAYADYCRATHEVKRIEMSIKSRLARASQEYEANLAAVKKFEGKILPDADTMLALSEQAYQAGELDFLQVLIVRKTFYDSKIRHLQARGDFAQASANIHGLLLTGGLGIQGEFINDDSLRGQSFGGQ